MATKKIKTDLSSNPFGGMLIQPIQHIAPVQAQTAVPASTPPLTPTTPKTPSEAHTEASESVSDVEPPTKPRKQAEKQAKGDDNKKERVCIYIPSEASDNLNIYGRAVGTSRSSVCNTIILAWLEEHKGEIEKYKNLLQSV